MDPFRRLVGGGLLERSAWVLDCICTASLERVAPARVQGCWEKLSCVLTVQSVTVRLKTSAA